MHEKDKQKFMWTLTMCPQNGHADLEIRLSGK